MPTGRRGDPSHMRRVYFLELRHGEVRYCPAPDDPGPPATKQQQGWPVKGEKEEGEDRPNAVTLLTLRSQREFRLCQVAIIGYTRWPFLDRPSAHPIGPTPRGS